MSESGLLRNTHHTDPQKRLFRPWTSAAADVCPNTERGKIIPKVHAYFPRIFPRKTLLSPRGWWSQIPCKDWPNTCASRQKYWKNFFCIPDFWVRWWDVQCISVNFRIILPLFFLGDVYQNWRNPPSLYYPPYFGPSPIILLFCSRGKSRFLTNFEKARKTLKPCVISVGFFKKSNFRGDFRAIELCPLGNVQFRPPWGTGFFFPLGKTGVCERVPPL